MKYCLTLKSLGGLSGPNNKWMGLERWLIIVLFRTWDIVVLILLGVTCKVGKTKYT